MEVAVAPSKAAIDSLVDRGASPDVLVLWERIESQLASATALLFPTTYTVSGEWRDGQIWGVIRQGRQTILEYQKVLGDDLYLGMPNGEGREQSTIAWEERRGLAVCVLVCRDVGAGQFADTTLSLLRQAPCVHRILAVPAHMSSDYFSDESISDRFLGITVALSNGRSGPGARASFLSDRATGKRDGYHPDARGMIHSELRKEHEHIPVDSPLRDFSWSVRGSPFRWAPDGSESLNKKCEGLQVTLAFIDDMDFPSVGLDDRRIDIPIYFIENLWAVCFAGVSFSLYLRENLDRMGQVIHLPDSGEIGDGRKLLQWSLERSVNGDRIPWPDDAVRPDIRSSIGSTMNTANVLFEIGVGFVLHHELAHVIHDLAGDHDDPQFSRSDESLADNIAAAAYVTQQEPDEKKQESRCLGIALVFLYSVGVDLFLADYLRKRGMEIPDSLRGDGQSEHPSSVFRLLQFMDDSYFGGTGHCHEICQVVLRSYCTVLRLDDLAMEIGTLEKGWQKDLALIEGFILRNDG